MKLGELKEECVYRKMGFAPHPGTEKCRTGTKTNASGKSVTIQQRFDASGSALPYSPPARGSICPDILYKGAEGEISCIRDLKFRCPKGQKEHQKETEQLQKYKRILKAPAKIIQPR